MRIRPLTLILTILLLVTGPLAASEHFCIRFHDVTGAGSLCDQEGSMAVEYHHLVDRPLDHGIPGPVQHNLIIVTKEADDADVALWQHLTNGSLIQTVWIESPNTSQQRTRFRYELTNARIIAIEPIIPHVQDPDNDRLGDLTRIRMDYQSIQIEVGQASPIIITP